MCEPGFGDYAFAMAIYWLSASFYLKVIETPKGKDIPVREFFFNLKYEDIPLIQFF